MFKELIDLRQTAVQYQERYQKFKADLESRRRERQQLQIQYNDLLAGDSDGSLESSVSELRKAKRRMEELDDEITVAEARLDRLERSRQEHLEKLAHAADSAWQAEAAKCDVALEPIFEEARAHRARLLMSLQKAGRVYGEARKVFDQLMDERTKIGLPRLYDSGTIDLRSLLQDIYEHGSLKKIGFFGGYDEFLQAYYQLKVPEWVEQYRQ